MSYWLPNWATDHAWLPKHSLAVAPVACQTRKQTTSNSARAFLCCYRLTAQKGRFPPRRLSPLSGCREDICLVSGEALPSSSDESSSPYATNDAMGEDFETMSSSVLGFFLGACSCDLGDASRFPGSIKNTNKKKGHQDTEHKERQARWNETFSIYHHHRVHRVHMKKEQKSN